MSRPSHPSSATPSGATASVFQPEESFARSLDEADPMRAYRDAFELPRRADGSPVIYLCGNSLGLQPKAARAIVEQELDDWARLGVAGHFKEGSAWYSYHEHCRETGARLVGGRPGAGEVVMMNSLTVNLHLMMVSFFRPTAERFRILMDWPAFPSDIYAIKSHLRTRDLDPADALIVARPRENEHTLRTEDIEGVLAEQGASIALVLLGGVNFYTGQILDMPRITAAAHAAGCTIGFDLAHAAGNTVLELHDWDVDFASWCSYKYLNAGPGAVAGCFVHERHARNIELPRYAGWWGNDPKTRFMMHLQPEFIARPDADGWQISNPPILALAPLRASLELFDAAGMTALRRKSQLLTPYLRYLIERNPAEWFEIITPREPEAHGCQLSILVHDHPKERFSALEAAGVVCDFREPNVIRVAPVPLYNSFMDVWRFARALAEGLEDVDG